MPPGFRVRVRATGTTPGGRRRRPWGAASPGPAPAACPWQCHDLPWPSRLPLLRPPPQPCWQARVLSGRSEHGRYVVPGSNLNTSTRAGPGDSPSRECRRHTQAVGPEPLSSRWSACGSRSPPDLRVRVRATVTGTPPGSLSRRLHRPSRCRTRHVAGVVRQPAARPRPPVRPVLRLSI